MCGHVGLEVSDEDVRLFVACRNNLVHRGRFDCETANEDDWLRCPPRESAWEEYKFVIGFLDRFFLRLFGYSGSYLDYQGHEQQLGPSPTDG